MRRKSKFAWYPDTFRNIWNRTREKGAKSGKRVARSFYQPTLELLEDRTLMAFSAVLSSTGLLTIDSTDDVDILLTTTGTPKEVKINGADPVRQSGTGPVLASQVTGIVVSDGDFANRIDLNVVISEDFTSLDSTVIITTAGGSDTIIGTAFKDSIVSGLGNDWIVPTWGTDTILTGDGDDTVAIESTLAGSTKRDVFIDLGPGNDCVMIPRPDGGEGDATIYGGPGNDSIDGGEGLDRIYGGDGDDVLTTSANGYSILFGQAGGDRLENKGHGRSMLLGGVGSDTLMSGLGADILIDAPYIYENASPLLMNLIFQEWIGPRLSAAQSTGNAFDSPPIDVAIRRLAGILTTGNNVTPPLLILPSFISEDNAPDTIQSAFGNDWVLRGIAQASSISTTVLGNEYGTWVDTTRNDVNPTRDDFVVPISTTSTTLSAVELLVNDSDAVTAGLTIASADANSVPPQSWTNEHAITFNYLPPGTGQSLVDVQIAWTSATTPARFAYRPNVVPLDPRSGWIEATVTRANTIEQTVSGDFDGDGLVDVIRIDPDSLDIARQTAPSFQTWSTLDSTVTWLDPMVGDFTGDGQDDLLMRHGLDRNWYIWSMFGGNIVTRQQWAPWRRSNEWSRPLVGDFDNDGKDDLFSFKQQNADLVIARSNGFGFDEQIWNNIRERIGSAYGSIPTEIAFDVGQLNGQGGDDVLVHDPRDNGDWAFVLADGYRFTNLSLPVSFPGWGGTYHVGNFDADRADEIVAWNATASNSRWDIAEVVGTTIQTRPPLGNAHAGRSDFIVKDIDWDGDEDFVSKPSGAGSPSWRILRTDAIGLTPVDSVAWDAWLDASSFLAGGERVVNEINPIVNLRLKTTLPGQPNWTDDAVILGDIPSSFSIGSPSSSTSVLVEFDTDGDGVVDGWSRPDPTTRTFEYRPYSLPAGGNSIRARIAISSASERTRVSLWSAGFGFDVTPKFGQLPIPCILGLVGDVGGQAGDQVAGDRKVRSATISHRVEPGSFNLGNLRIEFDHNGDGIPDGTALATSSPSNYVPSNLQPGTHSLRARTLLTGANRQVSEWSTPFSFSISTRLDVTYRDFINRKGTIPAGTTAANLHPHFELDLTTGIRTGIFREMVQPTLDSNRKPIYKSGSIWETENIALPNPLDFEPSSSGSGVLELLGPNNPEYPRTPAQYLGDWFTDNATFNQRIEGSLWFEEKAIGSGEFSYADSSFFPLSGMGFGNQGQGKNFSFTMELHATFTYREGQTLKSVGSDDDLWVFVNNQLVVDLGGIHSRAYRNRPVEMLGLVDGQSYPIDIFFAERHTTESNLNILLGLENLRSISATPPQLVEEYRFLTESSSIGQLIPIQRSSTNPPQAISFDIDELAFDTTDPASINDALELVLTDERGQSVVPTIGLDRQAFFNASEGRPIELAAGVAWVAGSVAGSGKIYVDVRQVPVNETIFLSARLINNDGLKQVGPDETTKARLLPTIQYHATLPNVNWQTARSFEAPPRASASIPDLSALSKVASFVGVDYGATSFDNVNDRLFVGLDLSPIGTRTIRGDYPFLVVVRDISDQSVRLEGAHGYTPEGDPYYDLSSLVFANDADDWNANDPVTTGELRFLNPEHRRFTYSLDFLGRVNAPPVMTSPPPSIEWYATNDNGFSYRFSAVDPEKDTITFTALSLPPSMELDSQTGVVRWIGPPVTGNYVVRVIAIDSREAKSEPATLLLKVLEPANRPPRFVTVPEEMARAGRDFTYGPRAVDPDGDVVQIQPLSLPPRALFDSSTRRIVWRPTQAEIGQVFPMVLKVIDGNGGEETQQATLRVVGDPLNGPPIILTEPSATHTIPSNATGTLIGNVSPTSINLTLADGQASLNHPVHVTLNTGVTNSVDVVFIVDRSPSMKDEHEWLIGSTSATAIVELMEQKLAALNITNNRYGFVLYGNSVEVRTKNGSKWAVDRTAPNDDSNSIVDTQEIQTLVLDQNQSQIVTEAASGNPFSPENAYTAILTALNPTSGYNFRPGAGINFILISDEDADDWSIQTQDQLLQSLVQNQITFSAIVSEQLNANDGNGNTENFTAQTPGWVITDDAWVGTSSSASIESLVLGNWDRQTVVTLSSEGGAGLVPGYASLEVEFLMPSVGPGGKFRYYFGYSDPNFYRYIEADYATSQWRIGWKEGLIGGNAIVDSGFLPQIIPGESHRIQVVRFQGVTPTAASDQFSTLDYILVDGKPLAKEFSELFPSGASKPGTDRVKAGRYGFAVYDATVELSGVRGGVVPKTDSIKIGSQFFSTWRQDFGLNGSRPVQGISTDGRAIVSTSTGTISYFQNGSPVADSSFPEVNKQSGVRDFWPLVQLTGGFLWNFEFISGRNQTGQPRSMGPPILGNFSATFAEVQSREIYESTRPELVPTDPSVIREIRVLPPTSGSGNNVSYQVDFVGDGRARDMALQFVTQFTYANNKRLPNQVTGIVGQIPVKINAPYSQQFRAIDPDDDRPLIFRWTEPTANHFGAMITPEGLFTWDPGTQYTSGQYAFSVTVEDGFGGSDTKRWTITLASSSSNAPPQFVMPTPNNGLATLPEARQGAEYEFDFRASDPNADRVRYFLIGTPPLGAELDAETGRFRWRPTAEGAVGFQLAAEDGRGGQTILTVSLNAASRQAGNSAPVITSSAPFPVAVVGQVYRDRVSATDSNNDAVRYILSSGPRGMAVDSESGEIAWKPLDNQLGVQDAVILARDARGMTTALPFAVRVYRVNEPPTLDAIPRLKGRPGQQLLFPLSSSDPDGDQLLFEFDPRTTATIPEGGRPTVSLNGELLWNVPANLTSGSYSFELHARDRRGGSARQTILVDIDPAATITPNVAPRVTQYVVENDHWSWEVALSAAGRTVEIDDVAILLGVTVDGTSLTLPLNGYGEMPPFNVLVREAGEIIARQEIRLFIARSGASSTKPVLSYNQVGPLVADVPFRSRPIAYSPNGSPITFQIIGTPPTGLTINSVTGELNWTPTRQQSGRYTINIRATAGTAQQELTLRLISMENAPPRFPLASLPPLVAGSGAWNRPLAGLDPNADDQAGLAYRLVSGPNGMSVNGNQLNYTPTTQGLHVFVVEVKDSRGSTGLWRDEIRVVAAGANRNPEIVAPSLQRILAGLRYLKQLNATDPDGDAITFRKISGPSNLFVSPTGLVEWQTSGSDVGRNTNSFEVEVIDARGGTSRRVLGIDVFNGGVDNRAAEITNSPRQAVLFGDTFTYQPIAVDPDNDVLNWSLEIGPEDTEFDPFTGAIRWTPKSAEIGRERFVIRVSDSFGGTFERGFVVQINTSNLPPIRLDDPPGFAIVGEPRMFPMRFEDPEGDPLTYNLTPSGSWLVYDEESQRLVGTPTQLGNHDFTMIVSDGTNSVPFSYRINVRNSGTPRPPVVNNFSPPTHGVLGTTYLYNPGASDPNNDPLTYEVTPTLPGASFVNNAFEWAIPNNYTRGFTPITIKIKDSTDRWITIPFGVTIVPTNAPPVISPALQAFRRVLGKEMRVDLRQYVSDPDPGDFPRISLTLQSSTGGLVEPILRPTGELIWAKENSALGSLTYRLTAIDRTGATATRDFTLFTDADTEAPKAEVIPPNSVVEVNAPVPLVIQSSDNVAVTRLQAIVRRVDIAGSTQLYDLSGTNFSPFTPKFADPGTYQVTPIVQDAAGNEGRGAPAFIRVVKFDAIPPKVTILSPIDSNVISEPTELRANIEFPTGAKSPKYRVRFYSMDNPDEAIWERTGTSNVNGAVIGDKIDPRLLPNGLYGITIEAEHIDSRVVRVDRTFTLESLSKIGNFAVSFTDMSVSVAGMPIVIQRSYDSFNVDRDNDFGKGWRINIANTKVDVDLTTTGTAFDSNLPTFRQGTRVTITLPGGKRETFSFEPFAPPGVIQYSFQPRFKGINGATSTLRFASNFALIPGARDGEYLVDDGFSPRSFNPADPLLGGSGNYILRTRAGIEYTIDAQTGDLLSQRDRLGNEITYTGNGVVNTATGLGVAWTYDSEGRIASMTGPGGQARTYTYSPTGDLIAVETQGGSKTEFEYGSSREHFLTAVRQQGRLIMQPIFDPVTGLLDKIVDADGKQANVEYAFAIGNNRTVERVVDTDSVMSSTSFAEVVKDSKGRAIREIRHVRERINQVWTTTGYQVTVFEYDEDGNLTASSRPFRLPANTPNVYDDGTPIFPTRTTFNGSGQPTTIIDANGGVTRFDYDRLGNLRSTTDPLGRTSLQFHDQDNGLLLESRDAEGRITRYRYDGAGNLTAVLTVEENGYNTIERIVSETRYDSAGLPIWTKNAAGLERHFIYDDRQQMILAYRVATDETQTTPNGFVIADRTVYDNDGRQIASRHYVIQVANTQSTSLVNAAISSIRDDATGAIAQWQTSTSYDPLGRTHESIDRFGTITRTTYDNRGLVVQTATQTRPTTATPANDTLVWMVTRTLFDDQGREILSTDPFLLSDPFAAGTAVFANVTNYDSLDRIVRTERRTGVQVNLAKIDSNDNTPFAAYRSTGVNMGTLIASSGMEWAQQTIYDDAGRVEYAVDLSTGLHSKNIYDNLDRVVKSIVHTSTNFNSPEALVSETIYDAVGQVTRTIDPAGKSTWYEYDKSGRQTAVVREAVLDPETGKVVYTRSETKYDKLGRQEMVRQNLRQTAAGDPSSVISTNPNSGDPLLVQETRYAYDSSGRLQQVMLPRVTNGDAGVPTYQYGYDALGNQTTQTTPRGGTTRFHFDVEGRSIGRTLPLGEQTPGDPNDFREWTSYELGTSSAGGDLVYGQTKETIDFEGRRTRILYDNRVGVGGRVKQIEHFLPDNNTSSADEQITYAYDSFGRQVEARRFSRVSGNLVLQRTEATSYDADGRVLSIIHSGVEVGATPQHIAYEYDSFGRHVRTYSVQQNAVQSDARYTYDPFSRLERVSVVRRFGGQLASPETTTYGYDRAGNLDWTDLPGAMAIDYVFDDQQRLIDEVYFLDSDGDHLLDWSDLNGEGIYSTSEGERPFHRFITTRDIQGRRASSLETSYSTIGSTIEEYRWTYDEAGRLSKEDYTQRLLGTGQGANGYTDYHEYDLNSNRIRVDRSLFNGETGGQISFIRKMTYDANDRLQAEVFDDLTANGDYTQDYTYGSNDSGTKLTRQVKAFGSIIDEVTYEYDAAGRQKMLTPFGYLLGSSDFLPGRSPNPTTYGYSIEGHRIRQQGSIDTRYLVDPQSPTGYAEVFESTDAGGNRLHYTLGQTIIGQTGGNNFGSGPTQLYVTDALGSVRQVISSTATQTYYAESGVSYDAFGNKSNSNLTLLNVAIGYAGQMFDQGRNSQGSITGQIYSRARYYQPGTGTFTTLDPYLGNPQNPLSLHKYLYVHADPVNATDPSGMMSLSSLGASVSSSLASIANAAALRTAVFFARATVQLGVRYNQALFNTANYAYNNQVKVELILATSSLIIDASLLVLDQIESKLASNNRSIPTPNFPRGDVIEEIAGANLAHNFPKIDIFEDGVAVSVKSHGFDEEIDLYEAIRQDIRKLDDVEESFLSGRNRQGAIVQIRPGDIKSVCLTVGVPENRQGVAQAISNRIRQLAVDSGRLIKLIPVRGWRK